MNTPEVLYHYTDINGLLGILQGKKIWATQLEYMNDRSEGVHVGHLATSHLEQLHKQEQNNQSGTFVSSLLTAYKPLSGIGTSGQTFVFSLSERPDVLSQWRGYTPNGGYAIGFYGQALAKIGWENRLRVKECTYDTYNNQVAVDSIIDRFCEKCRSEFIALKRSDSDQYYKELAHLLAGELSVNGVLIKHESFIEEKEWRLVGDAKLAGTKKFRPSGPYIRPYIEIPINSRFDGTEKEITCHPYNGPLLRDIWVSPGLDRNLVNDPLVDLVEASGLFISAIKHSQSPYRP